MLLITCQDAARNLIKRKEKKRGGLFICEARRESTLSASVTSRRGTAAICEFLSFADEIGRLNDRNIEKEKRGGGVTLLNDLGGGNITIVRKIRLLGLYGEHRTPLEATASTSDAGESAHVTHFQGEIVWDQKNLFLWILLVVRSSSSSATPHKKRKKNTNHKQKKKKKKKKKKKQNNKHQHKAKQISWVGIFLLYYVFRSFAFFL